MKQRLVLSVAATSDSQGRATFRLQVTELGFVYEGAVQVPGAPAGALFNGAVLNTNWGQWAGPTNFGPVQTWGGESFVATATGLTPSTSYTMTFTGVWMSEEDAEPIPPAAPISTVSVETATLLLAARVFNSPGQQVTIRPPTLTRRLTIVTNTGVVLPAAISISGDQSGTIYGTFSFDAVTFVRYVAIEPAVDQTYTVQFQGGGSVTCWIVASFTNPLIVAERALPIKNDLASSLPLRVAAPWEPYTASFALDAPVGANQQIIAAPAAGLAIYIQSLSGASGGLAAVASFAEFHAAGGALISTIVMQGAVGSGYSQQHIFPGGFKLPAATALQVNIVNGTMRASGTYWIGTSI